MLTDIFATRYHEKQIFEHFREPQRRLLVQAFRLIKEQLPTAYLDAFWSDLHSRISMELGMVTLGAAEYNWDGNRKTLNTKLMCEKWYMAPLSGPAYADTYVKNRLSLVELAFRKQGEQVAASLTAIDRLSATTRVKIPEPDAVAHALTLGSRSLDNLRTNTSRESQAYESTANELNIRLRQAGAGLHYHNGFLQIAGDLVSAQQIEEPFWSIVADEKWANIDHDMKEAVDARDTGGRDPAWHAARALESAIKVVSNARQLTTGKERGAQAFAENLLRGKLIATWEFDQLRLFFANVRNELGHGPGDKPMPELSPELTDWAIEFCMSWIKLLVRRHEK